MHNAGRAILQARPAASLKPKKAVEDFLFNRLFLLSLGAPGGGRAAAHLTLKRGKTNSGETRRLTRQNRAGGGSDKDSGWRIFCLAMLHKIPYVLMQRGREAVPCLACIKHKTILCARQGRLPDIACKNMCQPRTMNPRRGFGGDPIKTGCGAGVEDAMRLEPEHVRPSASSLLLRSF